MSLPFLLEIGTEEIPDWMIVPALNNLQDMFQGLLDQHALGGKVDVDRRHSPAFGPSRPGSSRASSRHRRTGSRSAEIGGRRRCGWVRQEDGHDARSIANRNHLQRRVLRFYKTNPRPSDQRLFSPVNYRI